MFISKNKQKSHFQLSLWIMSNWLKELRTKKNNFFPPTKTLDEAARSLVKYESLSSVLLCFSSVKQALYPNNNNKYLGFNLPDYIILQKFNLRAKLLECGEKLSGFLKLVRPLVVNINGLKSFLCLQFSQFSPPY